MLYFYWMKDQEREDFEQEIKKIRRETDRVINNMHRVVEDPTVLTEAISLLNRMGEVQEKLQEKLKELEDSNGKFTPGLWAG